MEGKLFGFSGNQYLLIDCVFVYLTVCVLFPIYTVFLPIACYPHVLYSWYFLNVLDEMRLDYENDKQIQLSYYFNL